MSEITKILLIFSHQSSHFLRKLSKNVLREVCLYLQDCLYPCIHRSTLQVFNLMRGTVTKRTLSHQFLDATVCCLCNSRTMLCIGSDPPARTVIGVDIRTAEVREWTAMTYSRAWAGVILWRNSVYVFGGNNAPPRKEAERFNPATNAWTELPSMSTPKAAFTPLHYLNKFYLIASGIGTAPIETFDPETETYDTLGVSIPGTGFETISFARGAEIVIVHYEGVLLRWDPMQTSYLQTALSMYESGVTFTSLPVFRFSECVYWMNYLTGKLVKFDLGTCEVSSWSSEIR